ncbi:MAG: hypothetical protein KJO35_05665, partial [Gammaproteobacteria bacterium]|nr:hypothetical protein [Gammaproteobacteria bacterium]
MALWNTPHPFYGKTLLVTVFLILAGCGVSESDEVAQDANTVESSSDSSETGSSGGSSGGTEIDNRVTGSIGDGPIVGARLRVTTRTGELLNETTISTADFDTTIRTRGNSYPLSFWADKGTDLVTGLEPDFTLLSVVRNPSERTISNVNPFSTLIYRTAGNSGAVPASEVEAARQAVLTRYSFGLDTSVFADPITTEVTDNNIHYIVKASETLGEMIRRTRDALLATGANADGDDVVSALAADLTDGWIDGVGESGTDARIAAIANTASAAVLLEAMSNQLQVNDTDSMSAMDLAIAQVRPNAPATSNTANIPVTATAREQLTRSLWAAYVVTADSRIFDTITAVESMSGEIQPGQLAAALPAGVHSVLR